MLDNASDPQAPEAAPLVRLLCAYCRVDLSLRDLPVYNAALRVEAVGFRDFEGGQIGVVVTPWFMNLVRLPAPGAEVEAGVRREAAMPGERVDLIGARLDGAPPFEFRPIVSPMNDFPSQAQAVLTAGEVMDTLFAPRAKDAVAPAPAAPVARALVAPLGEAPPKPATAAVEARAELAPPAQPAPEPLARVTGRRGLFTVLRR